MTTMINQDEVNKAVWSACDTFRGTISSEIYKDYVLTMLFLKYLSDVWQDKYDAYKKNSAIKNGASHAANRTLCAAYGSGLLFPVRKTL